MKKLLFLIVLVSTVYATDYYVKADGVDMGSIEASAHIRRRRLG